MYGSNNIFSRNNGTSSSYNYSSSTPSYNRNTAQKLGSYRTQYKFDEPPSHLTAVIQNWKVTPPLSITARQELLHLTPTEVRVEDYFMIRKKMLKSTHEDKLRDAIRSNCFNEALMKNQCYNLHPFSRDRPYDFDTIKSMARKTDGYNSNSSYSYNNNYSTGSQNNSSSYMRTSGQNIFTNGSSNNNNSSSNNYGGNSTNIFGRNTGNTGGSNSMSNSNIFVRNNNGNNSSNNNMFSQNQSSNNNGYSNNNISSSNIFNRDNNSGNNMFGQNNYNNNGNNNGGNNNPNLFNRGGNSNNGGNIFSNNNNSNNIFSNSNNNNRGGNIFGGNSGNNIFANQNGNNNYNNGGNNGGNNIFSNNNQTYGYSQNNMPNSFMNPDLFQEFTTTLKNFSEILKQAKTEPLDYQTSIPKANNSNSLFGDQGSFDNGFYDISNTMRRKRKQQQQVRVQFVPTQHAKRSNMFKNQMAKEEPNRFSQIIEQNQSFNGSRITKGVSQILVSGIRNYDSNDPEQRQSRSQRFSNNGSQKIDLTRSNTIWPSCNEPCLIELQLDIKWIDWNENKGEIQYKLIKQKIYCEQMKPNYKKWLLNVVHDLKKINPIVRSDATIEITHVQNISNHNSLIFRMKGALSQKIINLDRYQIQYRNVKKDCIFKLQIKNKDGEVRWEKPIKFAQLDCNMYEQLGFTLEDNQISCIVPQLNDKCVVCFNKLPDKIRHLMGNDSSNKTQAFNFFSNKIQGKTNGNFQLVDIWRNHDTGDEGWEIIVHKFF